RHLHVEDGLDRLLDLELVGVAGDLEVVLVPRLAQRGALLGDQRLAHDRTGVSHRTKTSFIRSSPPWVTSNASQPSRSCGFTWCASVILRFLRLRHERSTGSAASSSTSSVRLSYRPSDFRRSAIWRVLASLKASGSITDTAPSPALSESADTSAPRR